MNKKIYEIFNLRFKQVDNSHTRSQNNNRPNNIGMVSENIENNGSNIQSCINILNHQDSNIEMENNDPIVFEVNTFKENAEND